MHGGCATETVFRRRRCVSVAACCWSGGRYLLRSRPVSPKPSPATGPRGAGDATVHGRPHAGRPVTIDDVAKAHTADLQTQPEFDVRYLRYWVDEPNGKVFCLVDAPDADASNTVHRKAHGLVADAI